MKASPQQYRALYEKQGFVALPEILIPEQVNNLCAALESWHKENPDKTDLGVLHNNIWKEIAVFEKILYLGNLGSIAAHLMGSEEAIFFQDMLVWKHPQNPQKVEWHQDFSYWPLDRPKGVTIWIALDNANTANGGMRYIPGSHGWGECQPTRYDGKGAYSQDKGFPDLKIDQYSRTAVDIGCMRGHAIAHHPLNCHMSPANASALNRRAWSLTWLHPDTRWDPEHAPHPYNHWLSPKKGEILNAKKFPRFSKKKWSMDSESSMNSG